MVVHLRGSGVRLYDLIRAHSRSPFVSIRGSLVLLLLYLGPNDTPADQRDSDIASHFQHVTTVVF